MPATRREFLATSAILAAPVWSGFLQAQQALAGDPGQQVGPGMKLGLVTYNWGKDWDLPTILKNCAATHFAGVELRSTHKHGVEITLTADQRKEIRKQFADSPVTCVGLGSACEYHSPDPKIVDANIEETKAFIKLCHDIGGSGVKVRPNGLPKDVPVEKTLHQIGEALNVVAAYGADYGVEIRLEVHGKGTNELPHIKTIMDVATHPAAKVCWNCNQEDLAGEGLEHNFRLVQDRIATVHIHDLRTDGYPWKPLFRMLKGINFQGWTLLEDGPVPQDIVAAMRENHTIWKELAGTSP